MTDIQAAITALSRIAGPGALTKSIGSVERKLVGMTSQEARRQAEEVGFSSDALVAAQQVKALAGQVNVIIHAAGILVSLPHILGKDERIEALSLGAGNTGRAYDLTTNKQVAEFKFTEWRGGAEPIRQNELFVDLFNLATAQTGKRRVMYVVGKTIPLRFLENRRAIDSVLSHHSALKTRFAELHGDRYKTVNQYWHTIRDVVEIVDLRELVPELNPAGFADDHHP